MIVNRLKASSADHTHDVMVTQEPYAALKAKEPNSQDVSQRALNGAEIGEAKAALIKHYVELT